MVVQRQQQSCFSYLEYSFLLCLRTNEQYILILDGYKTILNTIEKDKNKSNELQEEKAICLGSIVKIKIKLLGEKKYDENLDNIENCISIAENILNKNENDCEWYKEALELKEILLNKIKEKKSKEYWKLNIMNHLLKDIIKIIKRRI